MERIDRVAGRGLAIGGTTAPVRRDADFTVPATGAPSGAAGAGNAASPSEAAPASALGAMLAVQEQAFDTIGDRKARRRGQTLLRALRDLQVELVAGRYDPSTMEALAALAAEPPEADTPGLAAALGAIVLRARVELARFGG